MICKYSFLTRKNKNMILHNTMLCDMPSYKTTICITCKSIVSVNLLKGDSKLKFSSVVYLIGTILGSIQNVDRYLK